MTLHPVAEDGKDSNYETVEVDECYYWSCCVCQRTHSKFHY